MNLCSAGCVDRRARKARHKEIASRENRDWRPEDGMILDDLADDAIRVLEHNYPSHPGIEEVRAVRVAE